MSTYEQFTVSRTIHAPASRVFDAWTDPAQVVGWFAPAGWSVPESEVEMDVRPGGEWKLQMVDDQRTAYPARFVYREIVRPERLRFTTGGPGAHHDDPAIPEATVTFRDAGEATELTFAGAAPEGEAAELEQGWAMMFERLDQQLVSG